MDTMELEEVVDLITISIAILLLGTKIIRLLGQKRKVKRIVVALTPLLLPASITISSNAHKVKMELNIRGRRQQISSILSEQ